MGPRLRTAFVALVVLVVVIVYTVTDNALVADACYLGVLVGAGLGAWIGALRAPVGRRLVPCLVATGLSLSALGDVLWTVLDRAGADTDVSVADPAWFASYVVLGVALWVVLSRSRRDQGFDLGFVIDAATIVVVSVLVFWRFSVDAIVTDSSVSPFVRAVWAGYPVADAVLLALVARILLSRNARAAIGVRFAVGLCLWLAADIAYLAEPGSAAVLDLMDAAWMIAPVLLAGAAWPTRAVRAPDLSPPAVGGWVSQLMVAVVPLLVPPTLELVTDLRHKPDRPLELVAGMTALIALAFVRTARLILSEQRAHRELEVARDAALEASTAKTMFLANMSHEIRTPLTTVLATGELLDDTPLTSLQRDLLAKMHRSGRHLMTLIEEVLDFSRVEAGQVELHAAKFDLHVFVADMADIYAERSRQQGNRFEWQVEPGVPHAVVGDATRLFQVLTNLLDNAMKFTDQGLVRLTVRPAGGDDVEFLVTDNGIGIREEDQGSLFESFSQVDGSATRRYGGSGLGLAICKELTALMGGAVTVESQLGAGSTFIVRIPLPGPPVAPPGDPIGRHHATVDAGQDPVRSSD